MKGKQLNSDHLLHQQVSQLLSAYLDGQMDARERYLVEQHLSTCSACRHELESLRQTVRLLRQLPAVAPPRPFTLRPERVIPERPPVWRWLFGIPGLATGLATLMCVMALAGVLLYNRIAYHGYVMPLARVPVTYNIPFTPTPLSMPEVGGTATQIAPTPVPAVAHDELGLPTEAPLPTPTLIQLAGPSTALATLPSETAREGHLPPSPIPFVTQPGQEGLAIAQPSPQRGEATGEARAEEEVGAQRHEAVAPPEPSPAVEAMVVPPATETPVSPTARPTEVPAVPKAPAPPAEEAAPPEPSPTVEATVVPPATETPVSPIALPTEVPAAPKAAAPPTEEAAPPEPSPTVEATVGPPATETPVSPIALPTEVPAAPKAAAPPTEEAAPPEPSPTVEAMVVPPETEAPVIPTALPTEAPAAPPSAEEAPTSIIEEAVPITPTISEEGAQAAPTTGPVEPTPTPTRIPIPVRDLRMTIKPGLIRIEGALPLPPGQLIQAELWREGQLMEWAIPETQRGKVQEEGRFELELKAQPEQPDFDLFRLTPAHYEVRIVPLEFEAPVEARIPFDTFPPKTKQP